MTSESKVGQLYEAFVAEHKAGGEADPLRYLDRLEGLDRLELEAMIDAYLTRAPRQKFDQAAFAASKAPEVVDKLERVLWGEAGMLPAVLPDLRNEAKLTRTSLVEKLAARLGVSGKEAKVAERYHELEQGLIPAARVSPKVFDALGELLGRSADWLRDQGRSAGSSGQTPGAVFARTAPAGERFYALREIVADRESAGEWDEVDELFLGGP